MRPWKSVSARAEWKYQTFNQFVLLEIARSKNTFVLVKMVNSI